MVSQTSRSGLRDWFVQRVTALLIGVYTLFLIIYLWVTHPISQHQWYTLSTNLVFKIGTFVVILSILWHAWIGIWTVLTDYVKNKPVRLCLDTIVCLLLIGYLGWTIELLWLAR